MKYVADANAPHKQVSTLDIVKALLQKISTDPEWSCATNMNRGDVG
jgi:hypothetical protein